MPNPELKKIIEYGGLERTGLSNKAIGAVRRIGRFAREHPTLTKQVLVGVAGYVASVAASEALHPEWGLIANMFAPLVFSISPVDGQYALNALQGLSQLALVVGGATGALSGAAEIIRNVKSAPDIKRGVAENPYDKMALMVDRTNEVSEGSTHGDFYKEFYRYLLTQRPDLLPKFIQKYGPVCEITPQDVSEPAEKELVPRYFRSSDPSNTELLSDIVKAERTQATISVLMSRSHTVWDNENAPSQDALDTTNNMNATITSTLKAGVIPRIVITNDQNITTHGAFDATTGTSLTDNVSAEKYFTERECKVIVAEREVMTDLVAKFQEKKYKKVILMNDGTEDGKRIAANWLADYKKRVESTPDLPEIISVQGELLGEALKKSDYDGVFLIGAEDKRVNEAAQAILKKQIDTGHETDGYRKVPIEILMEGRGSADNLEQISDYGGSVHYVHEILARKVVDTLLEE